MKASESWIFFERGNGLDLPEQLPQGPVAGDLEDPEIRVHGKVVHETVAADRVPDFVMGTGNLIGGQDIPDGAVLELFVLGALDSGESRGTGLTRTIIIILVSVLIRNLHKSPFDIYQAIRPFPRRRK